MFESYISKSHQNGSECAFSNLFVWRDCYHIYWCVAHDFLLLKVKRNNVDFYIQPFGGRDEDLPRLMQELKEEHQGKPFEMHGIYDFTKERFERVMPGLTYEEDRDNWDYVYLQEKLASLESGEDCIVLASGVAALSGLFFALLESGDHVIFSSVTDFAV